MPESTNPESMDQNTTPNPESPKEASEQVKKPTNCFVCQQPMVEGIVDTVEGKDVHEKCVERFNEVKRQRRIVKQQLYPLLLENTKNIADAQIFLQSLSVSIEQAFNNRKRTMKTDTLKLVDMLDPKSENYARYKAALSL